MKSNKKQFKEVKYKTTDSFGCLEEGLTINAILISECDGRALIYHPKVKGECGSFDICGYVVNKDYYMPIGDSEDNYVNVEEGVKLLEQKLFGKNFKFKRKFFTEAIINSYKEIK